MLSIHMFLHPTIVQWHSTPAYYLNACILEPAKLHTVQLEMPLVYAWSASPSLLFEAMTQRYGIAKLLLSALTVMIFDDHP